MASCRLLLAVCFLLISVTYAMDNYSIPKSKHKINYKDSAKLIKAQDEEESLYKGKLF